MDKLYYLLPAYNEALNLGGLFDRILQVSQDKQHPEYTIVVVDDGSTDHTKQILKDYQEQLPLEIVRHQSNQGLGLTIRDGLRHCLKLAPSENSVVLAMDADQSHDPKYAINMLAKVKEGYDVVIASRYVDNAQVYGLGKVRRTLSAGAGLLFSFFIRIPGVRDYTCGFRAYRICALKQAFTAYGQSFVSQRGFECMAEILIKLSRIPNLRFTEVSFDLRYDQKKGESKMKIMRTIYKTLKIIFFYGILRAGRKSQLYKNQEQTKD